MTIEVEVPTDIYARYHAHLHELTAELRLIDIGSEVDDAEPATSIRHLIVELLEPFRQIREQHIGEVTDAESRGDATLVVRTTLPSDAVEAACATALKLLDVLDEADDACRSGQLLTLPASHEVVAFRRWYIEESVRRLRQAAEQS